MTHLKYKCLVLDHDNTTVKTTPDIQYPAFLECLRYLGVNQKVNQDEFIDIEYTGIGKYLKQHYGISANTEVEIFDLFYSYAQEHQSKFYKGMIEIIKKQKENGGLICVVSKSPEWIIKRDYDYAGLPQPDMIFGFEFDEKLHKPSPYIIQQIMHTNHLQADEILVIDDKNPGLEMAEACHAKSIISGWGILHKKTLNEVKRHASYAECLHHVYQLNRVLFE